MPAQPQGEDALVARARGIHDSGRDHVDTHNDINLRSSPASAITRCGDQPGELKPKMKQGGPDVSFMIVYVGQSNLPQVADAFQPAGYDRAYKAASEKFNAVASPHRRTSPNEIELALDRRRRHRIAKSGKKVAVIGIRMATRRRRHQSREEFWQRGGRYMSLAHNGHSLTSEHGEADNQ